MPFPNEKPYKPPVMAFAAPSNLLKVLTLLIKLYHHVGQVSLMTNETILTFDQTTWNSFGISPIIPPDEIREALKKYYLALLPKLFDTFKQFYLEKQHALNTFKEAANMWEKQHPNHQNRPLAETRLDSWICLLEPKLQPQCVCPFAHSRQPNPKLKLENWALPPLTKMVAIIGDSNLARIPPFYHPSCQVESYPGAKINNIVHLLTTYAHQTVPQILIISIGINDCTGKMEPVQNFTTIIQTLPPSFQSSCLYFATLQVSGRQPSHVHCRAQRLNMSCSNWYLIPPIQNFMTQHDNVHWTEECGQTFASHWLGFCQQQHQMLAK